MIYQMVNILLTRMSGFKLHCSGEIYMIVVMCIFLQKEQQVLKAIIQIRLHMSKINNRFIHNAEDLDIFMLMYNLLE